MERRTEHVLLGTDFDDVIIARILQEAEGRPDDEVIGLLGLPVVTVDGMSEEEPDWISETLVPLEEHDDLALGHLVSVKVEEEIVMPVVE